MREHFEFAIDAYRLRARAISAEKQLYILATVSPLLSAGFAEIVPFYMALRKEGLKSLSDLPMERLLGLITPVARELAKMPKDEMWATIGECLNCVDLFQGAAWTPLWNATASRPQFSEFDDNLFLILRVCFVVFEASFAGFFPASLSSLRGGRKA